MLNGIKKSQKMIMCALIVNYEKLVSYGLGMVKKCTLIINNVSFSPFIDYN